jgi:hypothetical protein
VSGKPDFLIVGAAKCGTSSLAYNLNKHPDIFVWGGEIHYFSKYWERGREWYLSHFSEPAKVRGEKSPTYLYHRECHARIHGMLPDVKMIVMMRDPVARAFSNWNMRYRNKRLISMGLAFNSRRPKEQRLKSLDFDALVDDYLDREAKKNAGAETLLFQQPLDIIHRGLYLPQIRYLLKYFDRERMLFLVTERYFADEKKEYAGVCRFLNVPGADPGSFEKRRAGDYQMSIPGEAARKLRNFYRPYNEQLFRFLGYRVPEWEEQAGEHGHD